MTTKVSSRMQTAVPAKLNIKPGQKLIWEQQNESTFVIRILPEDIISHMKGIAKGSDLKQRLTELRISEINK